jgi:hypothetical protein
MERRRLRRRLLLANSHSGGGTSLEFPIYLVEGDNGQVGIDLFNYITDGFKPSFNEEDRTRYFTQNEKIYVDGYLMKACKVEFQYLPEIGWFEDTPNDVSFLHLGNFGNLEYDILRANLDPQGVFRYEVD